MTDATTNNFGIPIGSDNESLTAAPSNFFAQIEQATFEPSNIVPGIGFSPDKMLLGRVFSYSDAHRYRVGTNYAELPVNTAKNATINTYAKEGAMDYRYN
jgi:catalase